ncbi:MAG: hypothetical protein WD403_07310 [Pirellulales bacterium]
MSVQRVQVSAPSRLHFGMLAFGQAGARQFAGVGAMIDSPGVRLSISPGQRLEASGPASGRVLAFARQFVQAADWLDRPAGAVIEVEAAPPEHVGLGSGTSLGMAVALGLNAFFDGPWTRAEQLAQAVGRGRRSAIGVYGALAGGLLVDAGKLADGTISPLVSRVTLPEAWRFVLLSAPGEQGLSGEAERQAFERLPAVPAEVSADLCRQVLLELLPSAASGDFERFGESLYEFGRRAGECFASQQGGAYASPRVERLIEQVRRMGVRAAGQTSWGPTAFALLADEPQARQFVRDVQAKTLGLHATISAPAASGSHVVNR